MELYHQLDGASERFVRSAELARGRRLDAQWPAAGDRRCRSHTHRTVMGVCPRTSYSIHSSLLNTDSCLLQQLTLLLLLLLLPLLLLMMMTMMLFCRVYTFAAANCSPILIIIVCFIVLSSCVLFCRFITHESRMLRASLPSSGRPSVCLSVRPSVRPSHSWAVSKRCKLGSRNLHRGLSQAL